MSKTKTQKEDVRIDARILAQAIQDMGETLENVSVGIGHGGSYLSSRFTKCGYGTTEIPEQDMLLLEHIYGITRDSIKPRFVQEQAPKVQEYGPEFRAILANSIQLALSRFLHEEKTKNLIYSIMYQAMYNAIHVKEEENHADNSNV